LVRVARFGRLYKLVKLTKLLRILKILKDKSKILKQFKEYVKVGAGFERLVFFFMIFFILCHIVACLWIICATLVDDENFEGTWLSKYVEEGELTSDVYYVAFYWTITTITTVGYGDISGTNGLERAFCCIVMVIGVISFSFANGSLGSILFSYDAKNAKLLQQNEVLLKLSEDFKLPAKLTQKIKSSL